MVPTPIWDSHPIVRSMVDIMKPRFIGVLPAVAT